MAKKHTEEQIILMLKEQEAGIGTQEICRKYGISGATFYKWKSKFGGMGLSDAKRLKRLEDENRRLKGIVADLTLDNRVLKDINSKNF